MSKTAASTSAPLEYRRPDLVDFLLVADLDKAGPLIEASEFADDQPGNSCYGQPMAAAVSLGIQPSGPDMIAAEFARRNPRIAADLGVSVDELERLTATTTTLAEAQELGWISAEERRLYQGEATLADLRALGYGEDEALAILHEQRQDRACVSST